MTTYYFEVTAEITPGAGQSEIPAEVELEVKTRLEERLKSSGCEFGCGRARVTVREYYGG